MVISVIDVPFFVVIVSGIDDPLWSPPGAANRIDVTFMILTSVLLGEGSLIITEEISSDAPSRNQPV